MCDRLRCEKNGQPIFENCHDCLIPADGPAPEMFPLDKITLKYVGELSGDKFRERVRKSVELLDRHSVDFGVTTE